MIKDFLSCYIRPSPRHVEKRILRLVQHAWGNVPFYRSKMENAGITLADIKCLDDYVNKFPKTTSAEYRSYQQSTNSKGLIDVRLRPEELIEDRSSGSSGITISIHRTLRENEINRGRALWHLIRAGLRPWHRILAVLPPLQMAKNDSTFQLFGIFRRTTVNYTMPIQEIVELIQRTEINVIYGQKSFIRLIADYFSTHGIPAPKLELLIPGAEKVSASDRKFFFDTFHPTRYCEFYGATETYLIATRLQNNYQPDYKAVFFSLVDTKLFDDLTSGSILVTSLINEAQPVLKIELGDRILARNYDKLYELGTTIVEVEGRNNDYLVLPNGDRISGATFYATLEYFPFMRQFKIVQESVDDCTVFLKISESSEENRTQVEGILMRLFEGKIRYKIKYVEDIPMDPNGKTRILTSNIDRPQIFAH